MAPRTLYRETEDALSYGGDNFIQIIEATLRIVLLAKSHSWTGAQESGGDQRLFAFPRNLIPGDLLAQKNVVRFVFIESANDIVPVHPGTRPFDVLFETIRVGIACHVQPVPAPALAVMRRGEQLIDQARPGVGSIVCKILRGFLGRRR